MKLIKKLSLALMIAAATTAGTAYAYTPANIATVKTMNDDSVVQVRGKIMRHLGGDRYELQDATGKIRVEIDDYAPSQLVGRTVTVYGEVDVSGRHVEIEADRIRF